MVKLAISPSVIVFPEIPVLGFWVTSTDTTGGTCPAGSLSVTVTVALVPELGTR